MASLVSEAAPFSFRRVSLRELPRTSSDSVVQKRASEHTSTMRQGAEEVREQEKRTKLCTQLENFENYDSERCRHVNSPTAREFKMAHSP